MIKLFVLKLATGHTKGLLSQGEGLGSKGSVQGPHKHSPSGSLHSGEQVVWDTGGRGTDSLSVLSGLAVDTPGAPRASDCSLNRQFAV